MLYADLQDSLASLPDIYLSSAPRHFPALRFCLVPTHFLNNPASIESHTQIRDPVYVLIFWHTFQRFLLETYLAASTSLISSTEIVCRTRSS